MSEFEGLYSDTVKKPLFGSRLRVLGDAGERS